MKANKQLQYLPASSINFFINLSVGAPDANLSASASAESYSEIMRSDRRPAFCSCFARIMDCPSFSSSFCLRNSMTFPWNDSAGKIRLTRPHCSSSGALSLRPNMRKSFVRCTPIVCEMLRTQPFSGTIPRAEKGTCKKADSTARTMSASPANQAAPAPTAGPLRAKIRTFLWSINWRTNSVPGREVRA